MGLIKAGLGALTGGLAGGGLAGSLGALGQMATGGGGPKVGAGEAYQNPGLAVLFSLLQNMGDDGLLSAAGDAGMAKWGGKKKPNKLFGEKDTGAGYL